MEPIILNDQQRKKIQKIELEILIELDRICKKHNINYSLAYGTLIGAVRHHGFIPWDDDIDVCMKREDYNKFRKLCKTELSSKYFYQSHETDGEYFHLFDKIRVNNTCFKESYLKKYKIHHGIYIDIFPLDYIPDSNWKRKLQFYKFHFYRTGLMVKYIILSARNGKKKYAAMFLRILYIPFSLQWLYKKANSTAIKYNKVPGTKIHSFCGPYKEKDVFNKNIFDKFTSIAFEGKMVSIIQNYDIVLKKIYGEYMKLPPKEQRKTRHDLVELKL